MSLERELHEHLARASGALPAPPDRLSDVVRRGRRRRVAQGGLLAAVALAGAFALPTVVDGLTQTRVDLAPANPVPTLPSEASETSQTEAPPTDDVTEPTSEATDAPASEMTGGELPSVQIDELGAPVLSFSGRTVAFHDQRGSAEVGPGRGTVGNAVPDGSGGAVLAGNRTLYWLERADAGGVSPLTTLYRAEGFLTLRSMLRDGRVLFSDAVDAENGEVAVRFYAIALAPGATPEMMAEYSAYESGVEGPVTAVDGFVHGSCHLLCSLHRGFVEPKGEAIYHGGGGGGTTASIDGLTATPDGTFIAFVESNSFQPESKENPVVLVLLDGASFETVARIELPVDPGAEGAFNEVFIPPTVSISADGHRVLATHRRPFLVEGALTAEPRISTVDFDGALRWLDPEAANAP